MGGEEQEPTARAVARANRAHGGVGEQVGGGVGEHGQQIPRRVPAPVRSAVTAVPSHPRTRTAGAACFAAVRAASAVAAGGPGGPHHTTIGRHAVWRRWLREHRPPALVVWGRNDPFFGEPGAHAYRSDLPDAQVHVLDTGHFVLEDHLREVAPLVAEFLHRTWAADRPRS